MTAWQPYIDDRLIMRKPRYVIIKPADAEPNVPICCPLCESLMKNRDDEVAFIDFGCCHLCALLWAHPRRQAWKDGWRPSIDEVKHAVSLRPPLTVVLELD